MKILPGLTLVIAASLLSLGALADSDYPPKVKAIVEQRCMVCHGCYDAPCQLKLDAWAGMQRGASKELVYDGGRLKAASPTRLFVDAQNATGALDLYLRAGMRRERRFYAFEKQLV